MRQLAAHAIKVIVDGQRLDKLFSEFKNLDDANYNN